MAAVCLTLRGALSAGCGGLGRVHSENFAQPRDRLPITTIVGEGLTGSLPRSVVTHATVWAYRPNCYGPERGRPEAVLLESTRRRTESDGRLIDLTRGRASKPLTAQAFERRTDFAEPFCKARTACSTRAGQSRRNAVRRKPLRHKGLRALDSGTRREAAGRGCPVSGRSSMPARRRRRGSVCISCRCRRGRARCGRLSRCCSVSVSPVRRRRG